MPQGLATVAFPTSPSVPEAVYRLYSALTATVSFHADTGLGGKLIFAGSLAGQARGLLYAANIAGAASLAASADPTAQRAAIRDGVVDFLVTSLEEALRILKNEIRKRQPVSVGVALAPNLLVTQMLERGVLPDILPTVVPAMQLDQRELALPPQQAQVLLQQGALPIVEAAMLEGSYTTWSVEQNTARWLPRLDAAVLALIPPGDHLRSRWLRLAPRYLGRLAQQQHGVVLHAAEAAQLPNAIRQLMNQQTQEPGDIPAILLNGQPIA